VLKAVLEALLSTSLKLEQLLPNENCEHIAFHVGATAKHGAKIVIANEVAFGYREGQRERLRLPSSKSPSRCVDRSDTNATARSRELCDASPKTHPEHELAPCLARVSGLRVDDPLVIAAACQAVAQRVGRRTGLVRTEFRQRRTGAREREVAPEPCAGGRVLDLQ
jgi:hypothetical protein